MFYSETLLMIRKNKKGTLSKCWLAATMHLKFMGSGPFQLSKKEVNAVDITPTCNEIMNGINGNGAALQFSLYLASQLTIGAVRIFQKQTMFLEDDCRSGSNSMILPPKQKEKKRSIMKKQEKDSRKDSHTEISFSASQLFPQNQIDQNCIRENFHTLDLHNFSEDFGDHSLDEVRYRPDDEPLAKAIADALEFTKNPMAHCDRNESVQDMERTMDVGSVTVPIQISPQQMSVTEFQAHDLPKSTTPKRKSVRNHDETPTKRRVPTAVHFPIPNQPFPIPGEMVHPSEMAESPSYVSSARRSLFGAQNSVSIDMVEPGNVPHEDDGPALPAAAAMVVDETSQVQHPVEEMNVDEYVIPAENNGLESYLPNDSDKLHLDELNGNDLLPRSQKKKKKKLIIDKNKQIPIENLENPIFRTMERIDNLIQFPIKISAKKLLCLPSTGLGKVISSKIGSSLGRILTNFYVDWLMNHQEDALDRSQARSGHRDTYVNKTRLSVDVRGAAEVSNVFVTPRSSFGHSLRVQTTDEILENEVDQDEPQAQFVTSSTSPAPMSKSQQINTAIQSESGHVDQVVESIIETDDTFLPRESGDQGQEPSDRFEKESQRSDESLESPSTFLSMERFYNLLEEMWMKSIEIEGVPKLGLEEILPPAKTSCKEFLKYFSFCLELESRGKLFIEQEGIHGPVSITYLLSVEQPCHLMEAQAASVNPGINFLINLKNSP